MMMIIIIVITPFRNAMQCNGQFLCYVIAHSPVRLYWVGYIYKTNFCPKITSVLTISIYIPRNIRCSLARFLTPTYEAMTKRGQKNAVNLL